MPLVTKCTRSVPGPFTTSCRAGITRQLIVSACNASRSSSERMPACCSFWMNGLLTADPTTSPFRLSAAFALFNRRHVGAYAPLSVRAETLDHFSGQEKEKSGEHSEKQRNEK